MRKFYFFKSLPKTFNYTIKNNFIIFEGILTNQSFKFPNKLFYCNSTKSLLLIHKKIIKTFFSLLKKLINGISLGYKGILHLKGKGLRLQLKVTSTNNYCIYFKLGYSHKILFNLPLNMWAVILDRRRTLILYCFNYQFLQLILKKIRLYYPINLYKLRGFSSSNEILIQKKGNLN